MPVQGADMTINIHQEFPSSEFLESFRKKYPPEEIVTELKSLKDLRVLLIGETIIDEYHFVAPLGKVPKGTHMAVEFKRGETYVGGILACANHLADFCDKVDVVTAIGKDGQQPSIQRYLKPNVNAKFLFYEDAPTIVKRRFLDQTYLTKLFEVYFFKDTLATYLEEPIGEFIVNQVNQNKSYDLVLVVDYGHGLLTPHLVRILSESSAFLAVNAQCNTASIGFNPITKYKRANYFCLGESEISVSFQDKHCDVQSLMERLAKHVSLPGAVSITRGPRGSLIYDAASETFFATPALSQKVVDTVGAGDAFLSITAPCVARGFPMELVGFIGNAAGSLAIEILGNKTSVQADQLYGFIRKLLK